MKTIVIALALVASAAFATEHNTEHAKTEKAQHEMTHKKTHHVKAMKKEMHEKKEGEMACSHEDEAAGKCKAGEAHK